MQRQVIYLYRDILREARQKNPEERDAVTGYARSQFERCVPALVEPLGPADALLACTAGRITSFCMISAYMGDLTVLDAYVDC